MTAVRNPGGASACRGQQGGQRVHTVGGGEGERLSPRESRAAAAWCPRTSGETRTGTTKRRNEAASPRAIYAHLGLDGVSEGIAVGVLAHEARVDDVRGLCGESRDAARRADRCSPDVGVIALAHARHHPRRSAVSIDLPGRRASAPHRRERAPLDSDLQVIRKASLCDEFGRAQPSN